MYALTPFERNGFDLFNMFNDFDNSFFGRQPLCLFQAHPPNPAAGDSDIPVLPEPSLKTPLFLFLRLIVLIAATFISPSFLS